MWVSAFLGMATKYAEVVLAVRYRQRAADGTFYGGPMYYIRALGRGFAPLARLFALLGALAAFGIGNMVQANTAAEAAAFSLTAFFPALAETPLRLFVGLLLSLAVALALMGGAARIGRATERLVPLMSALYACMALTVILLHLPAAVRALGDIVTSPFPRARRSAARRASASRRRCAAAWSAACSPTRRAWVPRPSPTRARRRTTPTGRAFSASSRSLPTPSSSAP